MTEWQTICKWLDTVPGRNVLIGSEHQSDDGTRYTVECWESHGRSHISTGTGATQMEAIENAIREAKK